MIPVADEPSDNAPTLRELLADAEYSDAPFVDSFTPDGHFGVTVRNIGGVQTYWLRGAVGDHAARVVARTQYPSDLRRPTLHYVGGGLLGGDLRPL